jgi:hypothetical protein
VDKKPRTKNQILTFFKKAPPTTGGLYGKVRETLQGSFLQLLLPALFSHQPEQRWRNMLEQIEVHTRLLVLQLPRPLDTFQETSEGEASDDEAYDQYICLPTGSVAAHSVHEYPDRAAERKPHSDAVQGAFDVQS